MRFQGAVRIGTRGLNLRFQTDRSQISANWDIFISDIGDPIEFYEWGLGTRRGLDDIMNFTEVGLSRQVTTDLSQNALLNKMIYDGVKYYVTIKATTEKGLSSSHSSNGFVLDTSPPAQANVNVTHTVVDEEMGKVSISASWIGVEDVESGIKSSEVCLGTVPGSCLTNLFSVENATVAFINEFYPKQDIPYYFNIKIKNGAGLVTVLTSKEIFIDISPPSPGIVIDGDASDSDFTNNTNTLLVKWNGFVDAETEVNSCIWTVIEKMKNARNGRVLFEIPVNNSGRFRKVDLALTSGKKYVSKIRCYNKDGFSSFAESDGITVDVTPPTPGSVYDGSSKKMEIDFQSSVNVVGSTWDAFRDTDSSIMGYRWCAGTSPGSCDLIGFQWVGLRTSAKTKNVTLVAYQRYYITVEAVSGAGMTSQATSDGFTVDLSPPEITVSVYSTKPTNFMSVTQRKFFKRLEKICC